MARLNTQRREHLAGLSASCRYTPLPGLPHRQVHDVNGPERLQRCRRGQVHFLRAQLLLQSAIQQEGERRDKNVRFHAGWGALVDGAHLDDALQFTEASFDFGQFLVDLYCLHLTKTRIRIAYRALQPLAGSVRVADAVR